MARRNPLSPVHALVSSTRNIFSSGPQPLCLDDIKTLPNAGTDEDSGKLGQGSYGVVFGKQWKKSRKIVINGEPITYTEFAFRVTDFNSKTHFDNDGEINAEKRQIEFYKEVSHPNIVRYYEHFFEPGKLYILMELVNGKTFSELIRTDQFPRPRPREMLKWCYQLVSAVQYLHEKGIIHRDISLQNVMLNDRDRLLKLTDFGMAKESADSSVMTRAGGIKYRAPETMDLLHSDQCKVPPHYIMGAVDMYSVGIIMNAFATWQSPYSSSSSKKNEVQLYTKVPHGLRPDLVDPKDEYCPQQAFIDLITKCWHGDFKCRPSAADAKLELDKMGAK